MPIPLPPGSDRWLNSGAVKFRLADNFHITFHYLLPTRTDHPSVFFYIIRPMPEPQAQFAASIASEAVEVLEDHLLFPGGYLLPLSARGGGVPGNSFALPRPDMDTRLSRSMPPAPSMSGCAFYKWYRLIPMRPACPKYKSRNLLRKQ